MLKQLQHKRFIKMNEKLSSLRCYCYVLTGIGIAPIGNVNDSDHQRPDSVFKWAQ
jgi:hypothetical protein